MLRSLFHGADGLRAALLPEEMIWTWGSIGMVVEEAGLRVPVIF